MKRSFAGILAASALVASFAVSPAAFAADVSVTGTGSSYDNAIINACSTAATGVAVTYTKASSGAGRTAFNAGTVTFGAMDWQYSATDAKPSKAFTYVPLIAGPIVFAYNVPGLNLKLDAATASKILRGDITTWNDAAIAKINKGATLPSQPITLSYRSSGSGTTKNMVQYFRATAPSHGWKDSDTFATASGNSKGNTFGSNADAVAFIKKTAYTFGYADLADVLTAGVQTAALKNAAGAYVKPSVAATAKFIAAQSMASTGIVKPDYTEPIKGGYNLALVSYAAAPTAAGTAAADGLKTWLNAYLTTCAPAKAAGLGYVALTGTAQKTALKLAAKVG
jgi:phosphate transport system substrate-binding protein